MKQRRLGSKKTKKRTRRVNPERDPLSTKKAVTQRKPGVPKGGER